MGSNFSDTASVTVEPCREAERNQQWIVEGKMIQARAAPNLCLSVAINNHEIRHVGLDVQLAACNHTADVQVRHLTCFLSFSWLGDGLAD